MQHQGQASSFEDWLGARVLTPKHWLVYVACTAGLILDAIDLQVLGILAPTIVSDWDATDGLSRSLFALTALGMLFGASIAGVLSDRWGRRPLLLLSTVWFSVFSVTSAFSTSEFDLNLYRFLTGLGLGAFITSNMTYLAESLPKKSRALLMGLWTLALPVGNLCAVVLADTLVPTIGWRGVLIVCGLFAVPVFALMIVLPETALFLAKKGRGKQAEESAKWLVGETPGQFEVEPQQDALQRAAAQAVDLDPRKLTPLLTLWCSWNVAYFGAILWLPTLLKSAMPDLDVVTALLTLSSAGIVGRIAASLFMARIGQGRWLAMCAAFGAIAALSLGMTNSAMVWLAAIAVLGFFQDSGASAMVAWTPELFDTQRRATAVGMATSAGRAGTIASPLIVGSIIAYSTDLVFFSFAVAFIVAIFAVWLLVNYTKSEHPAAET